MDNEILKNYKTIEKVVLYIRSGWSGKCIEADKIMTSVIENKAYSEDTFIEIIDFDKHRDNLIALNIRLNPSILLLRYGRIENTQNDIFGVNQIQSLIKETFE